MNMLVLLAMIGFAGDVERLAAQQADTTVQAGSQYSAGSLHRTVLGSGYRDLWTTPIEVPVLQLDTAFGGLEAEELGGGAQTISIRLVSASGREFVFRSVNKDQSGGLHPDLRGTLVSAIAQDQVSTKHPGSAVVVAPLLESAGVLHATPVLAVMGDDPALGEFREQFAGMLGMLEERPNEDAETGPFSVYERIIGTDRLFERVRESHEDRPDQEAYVRARLVDLMIGDWDRHPDQWRWAQDDRGDYRYWLPIPRDRDNAFSNVNGLIGIVGGALRPNVFEFGPTYPALYGMLHNAQSLDRLILPGVSLERWESIAGDLQRRLTDDVIDAAVRRMPSEYLPLNAGRLASILKARRDDLHLAAREFHRQIAITPDLDATDEQDRVRIERMPGGELQLAFATSGGEVWAERSFDPAWTREVRIFLHGGNDVVEIVGDGPPAIGIRIIGGEGDDSVADETTGQRVYLFDSEGQIRVTGGGSPHVDRSDYEAPEVESVVENNAPPPRDWGSEMSWLSPTAEWRSDVGPVVGGGPVWTRYGFRRLPHARQFSVTGLYAPLETRFAAVADYEAVWTGSRMATVFNAEASNLELTRFYGFGNDTPAPANKEDHLIFSNHLSGSIGLRRYLGDRVAVEARGVGSYFDPEIPDGLPAGLTSARGLDSFGVGGGEVAMEVIGVENESLPRSGYRFEAAASGFPYVTGEVSDGFARGRATAAVYLPLPLASVAAFRGGGEAVWGDAPLQYAAFVGGGSSVRGYRTQRFAGDRSAFASAELRTKLAHTNMLIARGDVGVLGFFDVGRVWRDGESSSTWHDGVGGGLWFATLDGDLTAHAVYGYGDRHELSAGIGMPF